MIYLFRVIRHCDPDVGLALDRADDAWRANVASPGTTGEQQPLPRFVHCDCLG